MSCECKYCKCKDEYYCETYCECEVCGGYVDWEGEETNE